MGVAVGMGVLEDRPQTSKDQHAIDLLQCTLETTKKLIRLEPNSQLRGCLGRVNIFGRCFWKAL
jgi:AMMECR1 domain-containing protein